jgi:hypothetical protein
MVTKRMKTMALPAAAALAVVLLAGCQDRGPGSVQGTSEAARAAMAAEPLSIRSMQRIYGNRTWMWDDGAGFMNARDRTFVAWTGSGENASYADGNWFMTPTGNLCFRANWASVSGDGVAATCFEHRTDGARIFQRRQPDGEWYVFADSPIQPDDEINKLRPGDAVFSRYERNRDEVARRRGG